MRGTELRDRVCGERLIGAQAFTLKNLATDLWHTVAGDTARPAKAE